MKVVNRMLEDALAKEIEDRWHAEPFDEEAKVRKDWNKDTMYWM